MDNYQPEPRPYIISDFSALFSVAPLNVSVRRLNGDQGFVISGRVESLECVTFGSHPEPKITWWKNGEEIQHPRTEVGKFIFEGIWLESFFLSLEIKSERVVGEKYTLGITKINKKSLFGFNYE